MNSVVEHVNEKTAGLDDIRSCLTVLESDPDNESVRSVLENCVQQVTVQEDTASLMLDELDGTSDFDEYADVAEKLLGLAEKDNSYQEAAYRFIIPKAQQDLFKPFASGQLEGTGRTGAGAGRCRSRWYFGMSFQTAGDKRLLRADV